MNRPYLMNNSDGMIVLVLVAIMLVATVISGVALMRYANLETRMAGNQRHYKQSFFAADSGIELVFARPATALGPVGAEVGNDYTLPQTSLPDFLQGASITAKLVRQSNPPIGTGYSVNNFKSRYYEVTSIHGDQRIQAGAWKVFPHY